MSTAKSDIALGAISGVIGAVLLVPSYQEAAQVFLLPGDISPYLVPKVFLFAWIAISLGIFLKGLLSLKSDQTQTIKRNWFGIILVFVVVCLATFFMKTLGYLVVAPVAMVASVYLMGYRNISLNILVALVVSIGLYLMLVNLAGLSLPRIPILG